MKERKTVLAISGSIRKGSTNELIIQSIAQQFPSVEWKIFNGLTGLPYFMPGTVEDKIPDAVREWISEIDAADGVLFCTPEYVFSVPGVLKNALEWTVATTVFSNKPVALITASSLGEKGHESLLLILRTLGANITNTELLVSGVRARIDAKGNFTDNNTEKAIAQLINLFLQQIESRR
jgi:chromate reductase